MLSKKTLTLIFVIFCLILPLTFAITIIEPSQETYEGQIPYEVSFYITTNQTNCSLNIQDTQTYTFDNEYNNNISLNEGNYVWNVTCPNESTENNNLEIINSPLSTDTSINIISPENNIFEQGNFSISTNINTSTSVNCSLNIEQNPSYSFQATTGENNILISYALQTANYTWNITCDSIPATSSDNYNLYIDDNFPTINQCGETCFTIQDNYNEITCTVITPTTYQTYYDLKSEDTIPFPQEDNLSYQIECKDIAGNIITQTGVTSINLSAITTITLDKSSYEIGETPTVTINSFNGADLIVQMYTPSASNYFNSYSQTTFPKTIQLQQITEPGEHILSTILNYENQTITTNTSIIVTSSLSAEIKINDTVILPNDPVKFTAEINGEPTSITWDFDDGGTATGEEVTHSFTEAKEYEVTLTIVDQYKTITVTKDIDVRHRYSGEFYVYSGAKTNRVSGAYVEIELNEEDFNEKYSGNTDGNGRIVWSLIEGDHEYKVEKEGYYYVTEDITLIDDRTLWINLTQTVESIDPYNIILNTANNEKIFSDSSIKFSFNQNPQKEYECNLYTSLDERWWKKIDTIKVNNIDDQFSATDIDMGTNYWKIGCVIDGVEIFSETRTLNKQEKDNNNEDEFIKINDQYIDKIDESLASLQSLGSSEYELAQKIGLIDYLEEAKQTLEFSNRDIQNLDFIKADADKIEQRRSDLISDAKDSRITTPTSLSIIDSDEYYYYPKTEEIIPVVTDYLTQVEKDGSFETIISEFNENSKVLTKYYSFKIEYDDGTNLIATYIDKTGTNADGKELGILDTIPKEILEYASSNEITYLTPYKIIKDDPMIFSDYNTQSELKYYIHKELTKEQVESIKSIVIPKSMVKQGNKLTGFSIFSGSLGNSQYGWYILSIILIVLCISGYYAYDKIRAIKIKKQELNQEGLIKNSSKDTTIALTQQGTNNNINDIKNLITILSDNISKGNFQDAFVNYKQIKLIYNQKPNLSIKQNIVNLGNLLNFKYYEFIVNQILSNQIQKTDQIKIKLEKLFQNLPMDYRQKALTVRNKL